MLSAFLYAVNYDVVTKKEIEETFERLTQKVYDVTYYLEPEETEYLLDRNEAYTTVLQVNDTVSVYGEELLQEKSDLIITGWNESVIASVGTDIKKMEYSDYGETNDVKTGHSYNSEMKDESGLIYLRARYYMIQSMKEKKKVLHHRINTLILRITHISTQIEMVNTM